MPVGDSSSELRERGFCILSAPVAEPLVALPTYMLIVSFGLIDITVAHGPIEIAPGTHTEYNIPQHVWQSLTPRQRGMMRFPISKS